MIHIVTQVDSSIEDQVPFRKILSTEMYYELKEQFGDKFKAQMGAEADTYYITSDGY